MVRHRSLMRSRVAPTADPVENLSLPVCWIPDQELRELHPADDKGAHQVLTTLDGFDLSVWGI